MRLKFDLSHALFSSFDIDAGTRLLLKEVAHEPGIVGARRLLDAGCGTGIIGISLAASCPEMEVVMRDRDFRAVAFAARNAARNGLAVELYGLGGSRLEPGRKRHFSKIKVMERNAAPLRAEAGLLCEPEGRPYDAVLSNLPAKAGPALLAQYFRTLRSGLVRAGGIFAFVIVAPLAEQARAWCAESGFLLRRTVSTKNHMVAIAQVPEEPSAAGPDAASGRWFSQYLRSHAEKKVAGATFAWDGIQGLPEFDEPSYATTCALSLAQKVFAGLLVRRALVVEPGVGLAPLWMQAVLGPEEIVLRSHDTLALAASSHSLGNAGFHSAAPMLEPEFREAQSKEEQRPTNESEARLDGGGAPGAASAASAAPRHGPLEPASIDAAILFLEDIPGFDVAAYYWPLVSKVLKRGGALVVAGESTQTERAAHQKPPGFSKSPFAEHKKGWEAIAFRRD